MATIPRSSPARGAPRCSPLAKDARPTATTPDWRALVASRTLLFQPQPLDSPSQDGRSSHSTEQSQVTKSKIPSPSQLRTLPRRQLSYNSTDASAEHEESVNSASSTLSTCDVSSVSTPVLMVGEGEVDHAAAVEHALSGSTNQVFDSSLPCHVVVVLLSGKSEASAINSFSMGVTGPDPESLISSPAFLKAVKTHARFKPASRDQSYKASLRPYAAVATAILSCALVSISLLQQQLSHSWDCTIPV